jgi:hypothetical protein
MRVNLRARDTILREVGGRRKRGQRSSRENYSNADADFCFAETFKAREDGAGFAVADQLKIQRAEKQKQSEKNPWRRRKFHKRH